MEEIGASEDHATEESGDGPVRILYEKVRWLGKAIVKPLKRGEGPNKFRLSSADTATTTYDGDEGWNSRPPAKVRCERCESTILHAHPLDDIDCPRCVAEYDYDEFSRLELLEVTCPVCKSSMQHGQRHPERMDFFEWATCDKCRYHWEFKHSYS